VQSLREHYNDLVARKNALGEETPGKEPPVKLKNEEEVLTVLTQANDTLKTQADELRSKADAAEKDIKDRKDWIEFTFQKGKTFYDQGNYAKAVEEWGVLGPYLGESPQVRDKIEEAKKNYSEGKMAQKVIDTVEAKKASLLPLPAAVKSEATEPSSAGTAAPAAAQDAGEQGIQLVSGEIVSIDPPQKTMTVKLFTESGTEETLTVSFDEKTQVDGSQATNISAVQSGANIDLRYNPQTSRASYIYVY
jgi:hypothetical protein